LAYICQVNEQQHAMNATTELSKVYKATQCCDASDFQYAMDEVRRIAHKYGWTPALCARMASLVKASKP
jgi:hypothetical protein